MAIDYNKIREENIREYGEGKRHLEFFNRLYSDRTHFVYELLQNAEDAGATKIRFQLYPDNLKIMHNGRPFNEKDVRGICGIGTGTKKDDLTQIGKFGIGFKSVYAYTFAPEIHSESEHFIINHYVRPQTTEAIDIEAPWTTLFIFSFNAPDIEPNTACEEIASRLGNLNINTLLFLRKITEIEYELPENGSGVYRRKEKQIATRIRLVKLIGSDNGVASEGNWLVFEKPVTSKDLKSSAKVEIAFYLDAHDDHAEEGRYSIGKTNESPLYVYFPTEKETRLGFLIQGPYRTTPSRDNVPKYDEWNSQLIEATAVLLIEALDVIKKSNLLKIKMLSALPINYNDFPKDSIAYEIYDAVRIAFFTKEYLPTHDGSYTSSQNAKLARGSDLRTLLSRDQLNSIFQATNISWLSDEITQDRTPELRDYLINILHVSEITPEWLTNRITDTFLEEQPDEWFINFYKFISIRKELWRRKTGLRVYRGPLLSKKFIRLNDGTHVLPFTDNGSPNAYLSDGLHTESSFPIVKIDLTIDDDVRDFLHELGIPDLDIVEEVINVIIPKYSRTVTLSEHWNDMEKIVRAYTTDSQEKKRRLKNHLLETPFVMAELPGTGITKLVKPGQAYFRNNELLSYFDGYDKIGFVISDYNESVKEMLKSLGVRDKIKITKEGSNRYGHVIIRNEHSWHERGINGFDPSIEVDGLEHALSNPSVDRSAYIWNNIALQYLDCIYGKVEKASRQDYSNAKIEEGFSPFGALFASCRWLPKSDTEFEQPEKLFLDDLPEKFIKNEALADKLFLKKKADSKLAEQVGIAPEDIDFVRRYPEEFQKWKSRIIDKERPIFPVQTIANLERREEKLIDDYEVAPQKEYEKRERSVRTTRGYIDPKTWLKLNYTNENDQMICQICEEEMPFKKLNGEYYFEAVEILNAFNKESESQYLALCPLCAAMYKVFIKEVDDSLATLHKELINAEEPLIPLVLGDLKASIRFVDKHFYDLRIILNTEELI